MMINKTRILNEFIELVSVPCPSKDEKAEADLLVQKLQAMGLEVKVDDAGRSTWICLPPSYLKAFWLNRLMYTGVPSSSLAGTTQGQTVEPNLIFISSRILK